MTKSDVINKNRLVVLFHGYANESYKFNNPYNFIKIYKFNEVIQLAKETFPGATIYSPMLAHGNVLATESAAKIVAEQIEEVSRCCEKREFDDIVLVGYSMGAVLIRRLFTEASDLPKIWPQPNKGIEHNTKPLATVEPEFVNIEPKQWVEKVSRIVLIAGMGRGWSLDNAKTGIQRLFWSLGAIYGHGKPGRKPTIFDIRTGSPFIVQTRLRWLKLIHHRNKTGEMPQIIQLLGTVDQNVSPNDTVDFVVDLQKKHTRLVEVPQSGHPEIIWLKPSDKKHRSQQACKVRRDILSAAMTGDESMLKAYTIERDYLDDELPPKPDDSVDNLVFVIHGIRDTGYWTKKIAARVKAAAEQQDCTFVSRTPSYGYFPILPFLLPWYRRQKAEWLMDQYVEARATYPKAKFHYMGHSNGTYLCARALAEYPAADFKRIMFAGSVVRPDFPWAEYVYGGRVEKIYNAIATKDLVVALFPNGLRWYKFFDLGGAGHRGFEVDGLENEMFQLELEPGNTSKRMFVEGGHSAAKQESQWDEITDFIVNGTNPALNNPDFVKEQPSWSQWIGKVAPFLVTVLAVIVIGLFLFLLASIIHGLMPDVLMSSTDWLPNLPEGLQLTWETWISQGLTTHMFWMFVYVIVMRFMALKF